MNINLDIQRVVGYRLWCNKLWNAIRFAMRNLPATFKPPQLTCLPSAATTGPLGAPEGALAPRLSFTFSGSLPLACRWILAMLTACTERTVAALEAYRLDEATDAVYEWWQYKLCDVFIEASKPALSPAADGTPEQEQLKQVLALNSAAYPITMHLCSEQAACHLWRSCLAASRGEYHRQLLRDLETLSLYYVRSPWIVAGP